MRRLKKSDVFRRAWYGELGTQIWGIYSSTEQHDGIVWFTIIKNLLLNNEQFIKETIGIILARNRRKNIFWLPVSVVMVINTVKYRRNNIIISTKYFQQISQHHFSALSYSKWSQKLRWVSIYFILLLCVLMLVPNPFDDYNFIAYFNFAHSLLSLVEGMNFFFKFYFFFKDHLIKWISFPMQ